MATTLEIKLQANVEQLRAALQAAREDFERLKKAAIETGNQGGPALNPLDNAAKKTAISAGQTAQAFRQLPAQLTDVVTQLAGGQNPLLILIQQGGQVKDSFGGIRPAIAAIAPLFTPARIAAGLLLGTAALLATALAKGQAEATALTTSLALTGNASGRTAGELQDMAAAIDAISGTQAGATEALAQLVASGRVGGAELQKLALAAVELERVGGQSVADTVKQFTELGNDPVKSAVKLNETLNFLTPTIYAQIKALQESGLEANAAAIAQEAYANSITSRVAQIEGSLGTLQRAWNGVRSAAKEAWDTMLSVGRAASLQQQIAKQQAQVEGLEEQYRSAAAGIEGAGSTGAAEKSLADARARLGALQDQSKEETTLARKVGETAEQNKAVINAMQVRERLSKAALNDQQKLNKTLEEYRQAVADIRRGGGTVSPAEQAKEEAAIRAKFTNKGGAGRKPAQESGALENAQFALTRAQLEAEQKLLDDALKQSLTAYDQAYKDGLLGLEGYYTARESIERERLAKIVDLRKAELQAAQAREAEATRRKDQPAVLRAQGDVIKLQAELELAQGAEARLSAQIAAAKAKSQEQLNASKLRIDIELQQLQGISIDRASMVTSLRNQMQALFAEFKTDPVMTAKLEKIVEIRADTSQFDQRLAKIDQSQRKGTQPLDNQAATVNSQRSRGEISGVRAQAQIESINAAKSGELQKSLQQLQAEYDKLGEGGENAKRKLDLSEKINGLSTSIANLKPAVLDLGVAFEDSLAGNATQAFDDIINGTKSASQAFGDMAKAIIADIARVIIKMLVMKAVKALTGGFADGGPVQTFASGGSVSGPGGPRDDVIPAWLSNGEHVIDAKTVNQFGGHAFFNALRNIGQTGGSEKASSRISGTLANLGFAISSMASPPVARGLRFADGGAVPSVSTARSQATSLVQNFHISGSADQRTQAQMGAAAFQGANRAFRRNN